MSQSMQTLSSDVVLAVADLSGDGISPSRISDGAMYGSHWGQESRRAGALRVAIERALVDGCEVHLKALQRRLKTDNVEFLRVFLPDQREFLSM